MTSIRGLLASAIVALFAGFIIAALEIGGVINMAAVRVLLCLAWLVGVAGVGLSEAVLAHPPRHKKIILLAAAALLGAVLVWLNYWIEAHGAHHPKRPVDMSLVKPGRLIEWRITNTSGDAVQNTLYYYGLWNLDEPQLNASGPAVQIPVQRIDFINPGDPVGAVMNLPSDVGRLFGVASLNCPGCKERGYWIYIEHASVGWFAEMQGYDTKGLIVPYSSIASGGDREMEKLAPLKTRHSFGGPLHQPQ